MASPVSTFEIPVGHPEYPRGAFVMGAGTTYRVIIAPREDGTFTLELEYLGDMAWHLLAIHEADTGEHAFALAIQALYTLCAPAHEHAA
jgi:hypothetical protein